MINGTKRCKSSNRLKLCGMPVLFEILCCFLLLSFERNFQSCLGLNSEGLALLRFRERLAEDPFNALSSWNGGEYDASPCSWFGIQCSDGKVVALNLKDLCLRGTLAPELGDLDHIRSIILRNNSFYGTVPKEILGLKELAVLELVHNDFTGPIPLDLVNNLSLMTFLLDNKRFLDGACPDNKFMLSENLVDANQLSSASAKAAYDNKVISRNIGGPVDFVRWSRRLLQNPKPSKVDAKKDAKNLSASSAAPSPAPSPSPSPSPSPHKSPQKPQQKIISKPKTEVTAPKSSQSPAPSPSPSPTVHSQANSPAKNRTKPSPSPKSSPSPKVRSPAPAPAPSIKKGATSSTKKAPIGAPTVSFHSHTSTDPSAALSLNLKGSKSHGALIWSLIGGGSLLVVVSVIAIVFLRSSKVVTVKPWATGLSGQLQKAFVSGVPKLKRAELETACEDFSNIIGTLADSTVYKGTLSNGVEIAVVSSLVKSRQEWSRTLEAQFRKKVETLSKVNHKNFVNLIGFCEEEKPFSRMMVFEYAPNGTLFEHLHVKEAERLDWKMRLRIVMGMAYCLDHTHQLNPPIPHRDLQSSSVYLSEDYAAKLSDFSFWTEVTPEKMRSPSMQLLEASMADKESNVHNFGVLLLEIITGRIPYSLNGSVEDWVSEYLRADNLPREIIDPTLTNFQEEEIPKLFQIIKDCMHPDPQERPAMREVAVRLMQITGIEPDGATPRISPLWWAELEVMAAEATA